MGRKPSRWKHLPPAMRARQRGRRIYYYFDHGGKPRRETPLGSDYIIACARWAELARGTRQATPATPTFADAAALYQRTELSKRAGKTQREYIGAIRRLLAFFNDPPAPLDAIEPRHWAAYARTRPQISATRERAVFSVIWQAARDEGYTRAQNPASSWSGTISQRRYAMGDDVYSAIYAKADATLRDAMDLAYLTGQRPADVWSMTRPQVRAGYIHIEQRKTRERLRIAIVGELAALIERMAKRTVGTICQSLLVTEQGRPLTKHALRYRFDKARRLAADAASDELAPAIRAAQFRDLRAKSATDDEEGAQHRLGHATPATTAIYVRKTAGRKARPTR